MMLVGLGVGTIPDIVNAKYTALMFEVNSAVGVLDTIQNTYLSLIAQLN